MIFRGWAKNPNRVRTRIDATLGLGSVSFPGGKVENAEVHFSFYSAADGLGQERLDTVMTEDETRDMRDKLQRALDSIEEKRLRQARGESL
jgi:hypothetical protein